ncbi:MAG: tRNA pseudouridine(13) synthase TruD [Proteobacteria bacterium]|nr:tRNA pseudouridine(13) synthase TruD [Pseudomonadota bacterium]
MAALRSEPEDFVVEEELGFAAAGAGQHLLVRVRKRNANTAWVAAQLARLAGCRPQEVGYAGLKDRRAVAVQWFSLPRPRTPLEPAALRGEGFEALELIPHHRKLPRGALAGNRFAIRLRALAGSGAQLEQRLAPRLALIARAGVPNYFGPQRFGREGANLARMSAPLPALKPAERGFVLSAARSVLFNAVLAARVGAGSWGRLLGGDLASLEGRGSFFAVPAVDATLEGRAAALEIHPTGPLWGEGRPPSAAEVQALEERTAAAFATAAGLCVAAGMAQERRSLRLAVHELRATAEAEAVVLGFRLARGCYATAVLRELIEVPGPVADA